MFLLQKQGVAAFISAEERFYGEADLCADIILRRKFVIFTVQGFRQMHFLLIFKLMLI